MSSTHDVVANIAANTKRLLLDRNMSQVELSRLTSESEMNISRAVRGDCIIGISIGTITRIAEAFDVSIDRLVSPPPEKTLPKIANTA